eukprot:scaffold260591_cov26-Prasinocladus_malaysianus.AAC.1
MSEWRECNVRVTLKGGFPPPRTGASTVTELRVRCFLEPPKPKPPGAQTDEFPEASPETNQQGKAAKGGAKPKSKVKK